MTNPFFSVIVATCRGDHPFVHHREWHVLDKIVENLTKQSFRDFELIIVDLVWNFRKDYIKDKYSDVGFPILHVIDKDSVFRDLQLTRICSAKNTGIMYARGEHLIFSDDGQEWAADALSCLEKWARQGIGATCRLHRDHGAGPVECDSRWKAYGLDDVVNTKVVNAAGIGYFGGTMSMCPTENMLWCNGFDEMFDGSRQLEDGDMCRRLDSTGLNIALDGKPFIVEYDLSGCDNRVHRANTISKCNGSYCYPVWKEHPKRVRANDHLSTDDILDTFMSNKCLVINNESRCTVSKTICPMKCNNRSLVNIYKDSRLLFNLADMRNSSPWSEKA
jgi:hypothetical protein